MTEVTNSSRMRPPRRGDPMHSYHCSKCKVNWPAEDDYRSCPDCGQYTFHDSSREPDLRFADVVSIPHVWRVERYLELGFSEVDAQLLASATEQEQDSRGRTWTRALNWHRVAAAIDAGCSLPL